MPSPDQNSVDLPLMTLGGRVTQFDPMTLPTGASPFCQDVSFSGVAPDGAGMVAGVCTRPGMGTGFYANPFAGNPTVNYLKTFIDSQNIFHLLSLDSLGNVRDESPCPIPPGVPTIIGSVVGASYAQSDTLINREWIAISTIAHPGAGIDIPRQWDGTNFDRVSQVGPGAPPGVQDFLPLAGPLTLTALTPLTITSIQPDASNPNVIDVVLAADFPTNQVTGAILPQMGDTVSISSTTDYNGSQIITAITGPNSFQFYFNGTGDVESSGSVDFGLLKLTNTQLLVPYNFGPNSPATIANCNVTAYNTTGYQVRGVARVSSHPIYYVYNQIYGEGNGTGATLEFVGNIDAGVHQVAVCFITRQQYITKPSPYATWTAGGSKKALLTDIPTGPSNIIARVLIFTGVITAPATGGDFYYFDGAVPTPSAGTFPSMVINDNTTTSYVVDFISAVLENGELATNLYNLLELGECSHATAYSGRMFWNGERNKVPNFINLTFDGGFSTQTGAPLGWALDPTYGGGAAASPSPYWGGAWRITGDGTANDEGRISQSAYQDFLGVPILNVNTAYSMRVRMQATANVVVGIITYEIYSPSLGSLGTFVVSGLIPVGSYGEFIGALMPAQASIPSDVVFRLYASTPVSNGGSIDIDCIEIFPTLQPLLNTTLRGSYALDPESFDQLTGYQIVGAEDGEPIQATFNLLDGKLYILKENAMYSTQDDGQNEPSSWAIPQVSGVVGTGSSRGVAVGESWAIIAHKTGAYIFWGSEPVKITQEIQPDWDTINWNYDQTIYVLVDVQNKRIHIGAPTNGATKPNVEFVCDYAQLANAEGQVTAQDIAAHPQAYYSVYNPTKVVAPGKARKWTLWNISMNCAALAIMTDGSRHLLRGNGVGNGKVYDQLYTNTSDDGVAINSQYATAYMPQLEDEQALQLGSHRKTFKYLTGYASGSGTMNWTVYGAQDQRALTLSPLPLINPAHWDFEKNVNWVGERFSLLFGTNAVGSWFRLSKLSPTLQRDIISPVRGVA